MNTGAMTDPFGPTVTVVRSLANGDIARHTMPAQFAVWAVLCDDWNDGIEVLSARIEWGGVNAREWDMSA